MKKVILAATIVAASASAGFAGGFDEPEVAGPVIVQTEPSSGSFGSLGGNAALLLLGAAALAVALNSK